MANQRLRFTNFSYGLSDDDTVGAAYSASDLELIDFRKSPARLSLQKALTTEASGSSFKGPRTYDGARVDGGNMYFANGAYTYKRTPGSNGAVGTYGEETDSDGNSIPSADLDYRPDFDALFLYTTTGIHELSPLSGTPSYKINKFSYRMYFKQDNAFSDASTNPLHRLLINQSSISEVTLGGDDLRIPFTCTAEPLQRVELLMVTKDVAGTAGMTVVIHDASDNEIASQTIAHASLPPNGGAIVFDHFSGTDRMQIGADYHLHILIGTAGAGHYIASSGGNVQSTAAVYIYADALVATPAFIGHATHQLGAKTYFCNERYVGEWEFLDISGNDDVTTTSTGYDPHRIVLPASFIGIGISDYSEYIAVACSIADSVEDTSGENAGNGGKGMLIFWDTTSDTLNFTVPVPQGVPEGLFSHNNRLYFVARGRLYYWAGGDIIEVFEFPGVDEFIPDAATDAPQVDTYLSVSRHCMTVFNGLLHIGFPFQTANTNIKIGVYSFGANKSGLPEAIGYDYESCNGHKVTTFDTSTSPDTPATGISFLGGHSGTLLAAWTHGLGTNSGIDRVNETSDVVTAAMWKSLWFDNGDPDIAKAPLFMKVTFEELPTGCTVTPFIEYDHSGTDVTGTDSNSNTIQGVAGDVDVVLPLNAEDQFYQARVGIDLASAAANDIKITSITFKFDDNRDDTAATETSKNE